MNRDFQLEIKDSFERNREQCREFRYDFEIAPSIPRRARIASLASVGAILASLPTFSRPCPGDGDAFRQIMAASPNFDIPKAKRPMPHCWGRKRKAAYRRAMAAKG